MSDWKVWTEYWLVQSSYLLALFLSIATYTRSYLKLCEAYEVGWDFGIDMEQQQQLQEMPSPEMPLHKIQL